MKYSDQENQRVVKTVIQEMKSLEPSTPQVQVGGKYIANVYRKNGLWSMGGWGGGGVEKSPTYVRNKIQKHFQNVMLVGMASEISKNYTYKCVDRYGIKGAKAKCAH